MADDNSQEPHERISWFERIAHVFSGEPRTRADLQRLLTAACAEKIIDGDALRIIEGALHVGDMQVREIMVPRAQMDVLKADVPLSKLLPKIIETAHSRYPVVGEGLDNVLGILLAKDLLPQILKGEADQVNIRSLLRPAVFVPESKRLNVLLREFRENRNHMAVVIDEYGGVSGLVTIEDVLEEIVGDIEDEHDVDEDTYVRQISETDYLVRALMPIEDFNEQFHTDFSDEEFDTIGGLILQQFGYLPHRNEIATVGGYQFRVLNADNRQLHLLRMSPAPEAS
ncbi:MAG: transporter associated domain-containing protein [Spongiibacteraceae bacterium]|jgi:magnesium and cobalt transporter|nr:transporter associated domain-containing protein [Spongiibacteraceae bacterium]